MLVYVDNQSHQIAKIKVFLILKTDIHLQSDGTTIFRWTATVWCVLYRVFQKTDTQFYFWDNFGNSAPILTILSLLQAKIYGA